MKRFEGIFKDFGIPREEAEEMILQACLKAGWITEADFGGPADEELERRRGAPAEMRASWPPWVSREAPDTTAQ